MTRRSQFDIAPPPYTTSVGMPRAESRPLMLLVAAGALLLLAVGISWVSHRLQNRFLSELDEASLEQARRSFAEAIDQQRASVMAHATLLAEDMRVRNTVITPIFDEATVHDVLEDLKKVSGAGLLAVLDPGGRVRSVAGPQSLLGIDLGSSPVVKAALDKPAGDVWTFPDQVLVVAVAPVRAGGETAKLFAFGMEVGEPLLAGIQRTLGVAGAVMVRDRVIASSSNDEVLQQAFRAASGLEDGRSETVVAERAWVARASRASESAFAGRVVWLVPRHHQADHAGLLRLMSWTPIAVVGLALMLLASSLRSRALD